MLDCGIIKTIAKRTLGHYVESPIAYVVAILYFGFVGGVFGIQVFVDNYASINMIGTSSVWILWFIAPALTMSLLSDEIRSGTFESLSTLPIRDWEIVLGKYFGFLGLAGILMGSLLFYPIVISFVNASPTGMDWGPTLGIIVSQFFICAFYGAVGLFASSLTRNQVVALIVGMIFCTSFFFLGQFAPFFPGVLAQISDYFGVVSHVTTLSRGVWDFRDLLYFVSFSTFFLYLTVLKLSARRF